MHAETDLPNKPEANCTDNRINIAHATQIYNLPFTDLLLKAQHIHRQNFPANQVQLAKLLSIKTGGCPEDCGYCSQSARSDSKLKANKLLDVEAVLEGAKQAKAQGATRYCMGAAWRSPKDRDLPALVEMIEGVKSLGLETCMTLGMLSKEQAETLDKAGLDYYNHNIDTSEAYYPEVITSRTFQDRLDTLATVRKTSVKLCVGGILGMGETREDRISMLVTLANLPVAPESIPINQLIAIPGTKLAKAGAIDSFEFVRTIALARILMPSSTVRLAAGRTKMSDELQALCFMAGVNSIFIGDRLLTAENPEEDKDQALFNRLGLHPSCNSAAQPTSNYQDVNA